MRIRIQHFRLMRIRILIQGSDDQKCEKFTAKKASYFFNKCYLFFPRPSRTSFRRSLNPQKRTASTSKHEISSFFLFCPPGSGSAFPMQIRKDRPKSHADLDPQHWPRYWGKVQEKILFLSILNWLNQCCGSGPEDLHRHVIRPPFHHQAKIIRKTLIAIVLCLLWMT